MTALPFAPSSSVVARFLAGLLLFCLLPTLSNAQSCANPVALPLNGVVVVDGVTISASASGSGARTVEYGIYTDCGNITTVSPQLWLGAEDDPFNYTLNFGRSVNNVELLLNAAGLPENETFIFNTNGGAPDISLISSCFTSASGNVLRSGEVPGPGLGPGGAHFAVNTVSAYTSLTITGNGEMNGSLFNICGDNVTAVELGDVSIDIVSRGELDQLALGESMASVEALTSDGEVGIIRWQTLSQSGTVGFYLERRTEGGDWQRIKEALLPAIQPAPAGAEYLLLDETASSQRNDEYRIVELEADGNIQHYKPFHRQ